MKKAGVQTSLSRISCKKIQLQIIADSLYRQAVSGEAARSGVRLFFFADQLLPVLVVPDRVCEDLRMISAV